MAGGAHIGLDIKKSSLGYGLLSAAWTRMTIVSKNMTLLYCIYHLLLLTLFSFRLTTRQHS